MDIAGAGALAGRASLLNEHSLRRNYWRPWLSTSFDNSSLKQLKPATAQHVAPGNRLLVVLGKLAQTTAGKWIIHPPTRCPCVI
jgi:hypothetical protein